jgi:hypothetical protein
MQKDDADGMATKRYNAALFTLLRALAKPGDHPTANAAVMGKDL